VDPDRIGIMGSSAGGHLASTLLTHPVLGPGRACEQPSKSGGSLLCRHFHGPLQPCGIPSQSFGRQPFG
jgi:hypothetical protein